MTLLSTGPRKAALAALAAVALLAACASESRRAPATSTDLDKICHAVELAGAADLPEGDRMVQVAMWIDQNIRSDEGLAFLRSWAKLGNDVALRRKALEDATRAAGIRDCPLLAYWK